MNLTLLLSSLRKIYIKGGRNPLGEEESSRYAVKTALDTWLLSTVFVVVFPSWPWTGWLLLLWGCVKKVGMCWDSPWPSTRVRGWWFMSGLLLGFKNEAGPISSNRNHTHTLTPPTPLPPPSTTLPTPTPPPTPPHPTPPHAQTAEKERKHQYQAKGLWFISLTGCCKQRAKYDGTLIMFLDGYQSPAAPLESETQVSYLKLAPLLFNVNPLHHFHCCQTQFITEEFFC